ncbi:DNA-processing protein DprA [Corynebacterium macginleyi]|uniref:DNA-processing protein DprA n=1 Tax=Corynebacterium macginleyi TaxID=38290 RepID=UPI000EF9DEA2|nr:DNA-processing protein DprA [Corynebacterium macginleyi]QRP20930.1 DNA-protecting protein DprA [Corynebacterium macginleyi]RMB65531.1 DNA-processing protein DprA [Corynebacterium macginleyi]
MHTLTRPEEQNADILRLLRADLGLSQIERTDELVRLGDAQFVINEHSRTLFASHASEEEEIEQWKNQGYNLVNILEDTYPTVLRDVRESPAILYWQGKLETGEKGVSIVGSREASHEALEASFQLAKSLAQRKIPVISGLARGVDTAAHEGAIAAGGRTIAIMGTGLDRTSPVTNRALREKIQTGDGLVLSQFEPGAPVKKFNFPMRNAVMSGYGLATIVMAATEKSGTRHQVKAALNHGRKVIFTGTVANTVRWAKRLVDENKAIRVTSLAEAVDASIEVTLGYGEQTKLF